MAGGFREDAKCLVLRGVVCRQKASQSPDGPVYTAANWTLKRKRKTPCLGPMSLIGCCGSPSGSLGYWRVSWGTDEA